MLFDNCIATSADPVTAGLRLEQLLADTEAAACFGSLSDDLKKDFVSLISISGFLFRFSCRYPDIISEIGRPFELMPPPDTEFTSIEELKRYKYRQLFRITWMDLSGRFDYPCILQALSELAEYVVNQALKLSLRQEHLEVLQRHLSAFALGKLGASELNFSSDIDLIFVCSNTSSVDLPAHEYQKILQDGIRRLSSQLEKRTADGFLYRVDLKLRPWGSSGPLVMTIDETENYYEASSEAWERFAWLRARAISGPAELATDMIERLRPFIYRRSLSSEDLDRFIEIKNEMSKVRRRKGYWNVKVGEGGIRDLEFFIQMLQMVNAYSYADLQLTGTLKVLFGLQQHQFLTEIEAAEINHSYLFLRRLENRLQMVDEQQTHELPDDHGKRLVIARSLGISGGSDNEIMDNFETELFANQNLAQGYFERLLPGRGTA